MVIILTILMLFSASKCRDLNEEHRLNITDCLELSGKFVPDSAISKENIKLIVYFKNKCDTVISFYPKMGLLAFTRLDTSFSNNLYEINCDVKKLSLMVSLKPNEIFQDTYIINLRSSYFRTGMNDLMLQYVCRIQHKNVIRPRNLVTGHLESLPIHLYLR